MPADVDVLKARAQQLTLMASMPEYGFDIINVGPEDHKLSAVLQLPSRAALAGFFHWVWHHRLCMLTSLMHGSGGDLVPSGPAWQLTLQEHQDLFQLLLPLAKAEAGQRTPLSPPCLHKHSQRRSSIANAMPREGAASPSIAGLHVCAEPSRDAGVVPGQ